MLTHASRALRAGSRWTDAIPVCVFDQGSTPGAYLREGDREEGREAGRGERGKEGERERESERERERERESESEREMLLWD